MSSISAIVREVRQRVKTILGAHLALSQWGRRVRWGQSETFLERAVDKVIGAAFGNSADAEFDVEVLNVYIRGLTRAQIDEHFREAWESMRARPTAARRGVRRRAASI